MRSTFLLTMTGLIVLAFVLFMVTYSVRFTEAAVVTTFGKATESAVKNPEGDEAGLYFKWPYPVQSVTKYDRRVRILETRSETYETADNRPLIFEAFLTWRVTDPLVFYQRFSNAGPEARDHYNAAQRTLDALLRSAMGTVSGYRMSDLFASGSGESRLAEFEQGVLEQLRRSDTAQEGRLSDYGVAVEMVGVRRIVLPEETTRDVYERMKATRDKLAAEARAQGDAIASTITNEAESQAERILSFARRLAAEIRNKGDLEAARWLEQLEQAPELAVFLQNVELMKQGFGKQVTLVVPTNFPGMQLLDPTNLMNASRGDLPEFEAPGSSTPAVPGRTPRSEGSPR
ncbi:MAG: protease modulator HflC [Phycisphaerales bacterium]